MDGNLGGSRLTIVFCEGDSSKAGLDGIVESREEDWVRNRLDGGM